MRALRRIAAGIGILILLVAACIAGALWLTLPGNHETASLPGLSAPVSITFDQDGIPRIHAASAEDAAEALGYVHARDRMFQMELMRRAASGRLSEIAGSSTLYLDRFMRTLGLRQAAVADLQNLPAKTRAMLDAYARGVNARIAERGRFIAPEFITLGRPEPWTPVDSLLWGKTMALYLSSNYRTELARAALAGKLTPEQIRQLWPAQPNVPPPDAQALDVRYADAARALLRVLPHFPAPFTLPQTASNEWAVDGRHSATGAPLLAGDPHLAFGMPAIWYLARIETPGGVLAGATAPGLPFLVLGHNSHIAWSFTTTGADTEDVFTETQVDATHYAGPGGKLPYTVREERIHVRGEPDDVLAVRATRHGPVISDLDGGGKGPVYAVEMAALAPGDTAAAGLEALNEAQTVDDAGRAAALISAPVQNLIVADNQRIALYMTGRVPIRRAGDGYAPVEGADGAHDWTGFASGEQLPHFVAPESGRLVNANERVAPEDSQPFLGSDWFGDWRARRIRQMLNGQDRLTVTDFAAMQSDVRSTYAAQLLPVLLKVPASGPAAQALAQLQGWDGAMMRDSPAPLIFNAWLDNFRAAVLAKAGTGESAAVADLEFTAYVLSPAGASWCGGDCAPMLSDTLSATTAELARTYGADPSRWRWGQAHQAVFANPALENIPVIGTLTTARIPAPGDDSTVDRGGMRHGPGAHGFDAVHGAAYRGAYDLAHLDQSRFMIAPGESGNPISRHARDFLERWRDGGTIALAAQPNHMEATLTLAPEHAP